MSFSTIIKNVSHSSTDPQKSDQTAADKIRDLISSDAKINEITGTHTALTLAAEKGCLKSVEALLESKTIKINHKNKLGLPAIAIPHIADEIGYRIVLTLLNDSRFDPNKYAGTTHIAKHLFDSASRVKTTDHLHGCLENKKDIQNRATDLVIQVLNNPKMAWNKLVANDVASINDVVIAERLIASFKGKSQAETLAAVKRVLEGDTCLKQFLQSNHDNRGMISRLRQSGLEKLQALQKSCELAEQQRIQKEAASRSPKNYPGMYGSFGDTELVSFRDMRATSKSASNFADVEMDSTNKVVGPSRLTMN